MMGLYLYLAMGVGEGLKWTKYLDRPQPRSRLVAFVVRLTTTESVGRVCHVQMGLGLGFSAKCLNWNE